jgi:hypothetical protein
MKAAWVWSNICLGLTHTGVALLKLNPLKLLRNRQQQTSSKDNSSNSNKTSSRTKTTPTTTSRTPKPT